VNVWLVGGTTVIPTSVEDAIKGDGYTVKRVSGSDRYETAANIAAKGAELAGKKAPKVFVASGESFADALAVAPVAYKQQYPIVLTAKDSTSDFSKKALGNIGTDNKILVGGTAVVSDKVATDLSIKSEQRVAGADRAVTANLVSDWAKKSEGFSSANAALVGGTNGNGADSLVASAFLGKNSTTLHFAGWPATQTYLTEHASELTGKGFVFGGKAAVPGDQVDKAQAAAQAQVSNMTYSVKAAGATAVTVSSGSPSDNAGVLQYTVTGLSSDKVNIALVDSADIISDGSGQVWFKVASSSATTASLSAGHGAVTVINGVGNGSTPATGIKPSNGTITFAVDATTVGKTVPVVYSNADDTTSLSVDKASIKSVTVDRVSGYYAKATEAFGLGEKIAWSAIAAKTGSYSSFTVTSVDKKNKTFQANDGSDYRTFTYGAAGSSYIYPQNNVKLTTDQFESVISKDDVVSVTYNASGPSDFTIVSDVPTAPSEVKGVYNAALGGSGGIKLTWSPTVSAVADTYLIKRYKVTDGVVAVSPEATYTDNGGSAALKTYSDTNASAGTYVYTVTAVDTTPNPDVLGEESSESAKVDVPKGTIPGAVEGAPFIKDVRVTDNGTAFAVDNGDVIQILLNEPATGFSSNGTSFRLSDGTVSGTVTIGQNAVAQYLAAGTYTIDGKSVTVVANQLVQIQMITGPTNFTPSTASSVAWPAKITQITNNVQDLDEQKSVDLAKGDGSADTASGALQAATWSTYVPAAPVGTAAATVTAGQIRFAGIGAGNGNYPTASLSVEYRLDSSGPGGAWTSAAVVAGDNGVKVITGLTSNSAYDVRIKATNVNGSTVTALADVTPA